MIGVELNLSLKLLLLFYLESDYVTAVLTSVLWHVRIGIIVLIRETFKNCTMNTTLFDTLDDNLKLFVTIEPFAIVFGKLR